MRPRHVRWALRARRAGAKHAFKIVRIAVREKLGVAMAFALVEQESGFRNIFGHDRGSILHGLPVTHSRVLFLLEWVRRGKPSNGVGLTQLTWPGFIRDAERRGGAHKPWVQLEVGFGIMAEIIRREGLDGAWRYNGAPSYQQEIMAKRKHWREVLRGR